MFWRTRWCAGATSARRVVRRRQGAGLPYRLRVRWEHSRGAQDYGGVALHPIDVLRPSSGRLLAAAADRNVDKISAVVAPHPTRDWLLAAASGSVYLWEPDDEAEEEGAEGEEEALRGAQGRPVNGDRSTWPN